MDATTFRNATNALKAGVSVSDLTETEARALAIQARRQEVKAEVWEER